MVLKASKIVRNSMQVKPKINPVSKEIMRGSTALLDEEEQRILRTLY